jgi:DNA phosphorothioation-associated putative methyltransferase
VADALLFETGNQSAIDRACREAAVGKLTPEALYVHVTALPRLKPILRVYEGCGRALAGSVDQATLIKLNRIEPKVAYMVYPDFDHEPHPVLSTSVRADLRRLNIKFRDFRKSENPPILHRKETFVAADYPNRDKFARLTTQEEELGLLSDPVGIGTRKNWVERLDRIGVRCWGHRLVRQREVVDPTETDKSTPTGA